MHRDWLGWIPSVPNITSFRWPRSVEGLRRAFTGTRPSVWMTCFFFETCFWLFGSWLQLFSRVLILEVHWTPAYLHRCGAAVEDADGPLVNIRHSSHPAVDDLALQVESCIRNPRIQMAKYRTCSLFIWSIYAYMHVCVCVCVCMCRCR